MEPIAKFVRRETYSATTDQNTIIPKPSKKDLVAATGAYGDAIERLPKWSDLGNEEPCSRLSRRCSKIVHVKRKDRYDKRQSHWLKVSERKYD